MSAFDKQIAGNHYKNFVIQPTEFIHKNGIGFVEGSVIKYVCRYKNKNGIEDLKKAIHYLELMIEMESDPIKDEPIDNDGWIKHDGSEGCPVPSACKLWFKQGDSQVCGGPDMKCTAGDLFWGNYITEYKVIE